MADADQPQTPRCAIQQVPLEVLLRITQHLDTPDLGCFRLTCRGIEQALYSTFTREFFTIKQFMVTEFSLQVLIDIANSRLGPHLRCVYIGQESFPENMHRPLPDDERELRFRQRYADQFCLWNGGYHRDMLAQAFAALPNLEDVVIRDFNSRRRTRDGLNYEWTSYGMSSFFKETGVMLNQGNSGTWGSMNPSQYSSQIFAAVIAALGQAGVRPKGIEVMSRKGNNLGDYAFAISRFNETSVVPMLQELKKLHLAIDFAWRDNISVWPVGSPRVAPYMLIRKFLSHCPNLENLRLNENNSYNSGLNQMLQWLAHPANQPIPPPQVPSGQTLTPLMISPPSPTLSNLKELSLGTMKVDEVDLLGVIQKFAPSLKRLELWRVSLLRSAPDNSGLPPKIVFWAKFFARLKDTPNLDLRHIKAGMLQQQWAGMGHQIQVRFRNTGPVIEYTGPDWKHFLGEKLAGLEADWPTSRSESEADSDDSVESDLEMDHSGLSDSDSDEDLVTHILNYQTAM
jgi:hypothetical protein